MNTPRWELPAAELAPVQVQPMIQSLSGEWFKLVRVHRDVRVVGVQPILAVRPEGLAGRLYLRLGECGKTESCLGPVIVEGDRLVDAAGYALRSPAEQAAVVSRFPYGTRVDFDLDTLSLAISQNEAPPPALPPPRPLPFIPAYLREETQEPPPRRLEDQQGQGPVI